MSRKWRQAGCGTLITVDGYPAGYEVGMLLRDQRKVFGEIFNVSSGIVDDR